MDFLPKDPILEFNADTLQAVRNTYGLDKPKEMAEAINIFDDWVQKQNHFVKKDFNKEFLERIIIACKGSVERAKTRLDKMCTLRTLMPHFFGDYDIRNDFQNLEHHIYTPIPSLTKDNERVFIFKAGGSGYNSAMFLDAYRRCIMVFEYLRANDYVNSYIFVLDLMETSLSKILLELNISQMREVTTIISEGYGNRVTCIHILSTSKIIDTFVSLIKTMVSAKIGERIQVHQKIEAIHEFVPKNLLPMEYGGKERSLLKLNDDWINVLSSKDFKEYRKEINKACTNESCRLPDAFNDQYLGMPGTFRTLNVD